MTAIFRVSLYSANPVNGRSQSFLFQLVKQFDSNFTYAASNGPCLEAFKVSIVRIGLDLVAKVKFRVACPAVEAIKMGLHMLFVDISCTTVILS